MANQSNALMNIPVGGTSTRFDDACAHFAALTVEAVGVHGKTLILWEGTTDVTTTMAADEVGGTIYFGQPTTNGAFRFVKSGADPGSTLSVQQLEVGVWVTKVTWA